MSRFHRGRTERALATILSVHDPKFLIDGNPYSSGGRTPVGERVRVRVKPDGADEFESEAKVRAHSSFAFEHRDTYVLYDPGEPDHCDIDYERLEQEFGLTNLTCFPSRADGVDALRYGPESPVSPSSTATAPIDSTPDPPPSQPASDSPPADPLVGALAELADLHRGGSLTDAEFADAKARLLETGP